MIYSQKETSEMIFSEGGLLSKITKRMTSHDVNENRVDMYEKCYD